MNRREDIQRLSIVSLDRLEMILTFLDRTQSLAGVNAEVGVYRGGTALLIAANSPKELYAFDTFEGLPKPNYAVDLHHEGEFATSYEEVQKELAGLPNAHLIKAVFPDCVPHYAKINQCSFVFLDVDLYQSTKDALGFFWDRMVPGGIIVTDDYDWWKTPGVKQAWDEYFGSYRAQCFGNKLAWAVK